MIRKLARRAVLLSVPLVMLAAASGTAAVSAPPATVHFLNQAQLQSDGMVLVNLNYSCSPSSSGAGGNLIVLAHQKGAIGFGSTTVTCDGVTHAATLFLAPGPFTTGRAVAFAFVGNQASHATARARLTVK
jgi:hypothetical protein